jgi:hypothetical protein
LGRDLNQIRPLNPKQKSFEDSEFIISMRVRL